MSRDPVEEWGLWADKKSLQELIVAKVFNVALSDNVAAMLAAKHPCYHDIRKHHIDAILSFVKVSSDPRNPYPDLLRQWEADHFGNSREIRDVRCRIAYLASRVMGQRRRR